MNRGLAAVVSLRQKEFFRLIGIVVDVDFADVVKLAKSSDWLTSDAIRAKPSYKASSILLIQKRILLKDPRIPYSGIVVVQGGSKVELILHVKGQIRSQRSVSNAVTARLLGSFFLACKRDSRSASASSTVDSSDAETVEPATEAPSLVVSEYMQAADDENKTQHSQDRKKYHERC